MFPESERAVPGCKLALWLHIDQPPSRRCAY